jgi:TrmH family RNA methyltransferase
MKKITQLSTPSTIFAVFYKRDYCLDLDDLIKEKSLILALDSVQDPGNLGTIIRIADWFGIKHIICSYNTVDIYNSKTVQATMGAMARVKIYYTDLFLYSYLTYHVKCSWNSIAFCFPYCACFWFSCYDLVL